MLAGATSFNLKGWNQNRFTFTLGGAGVALRCSYLDAGLKSETK
jgi:hypothetical protein